MAHWEEEEYEVQKVLKVYPDNNVALIQWDDNSITIEPIEHLTNCDDSLMIRLNEILDRNKAEEEKEKEFLIKFLELK